MGNVLRSINPATGETIQEYREMSGEDIAAIIERAHDAWDGWRRTPFAERSVLMRRAAAILREKAGEFALLMAKEMGKPVRQGAGESEKCAWVCEYYADNAERFLARETIPTDASRSFVAFEPLGVVLAVMPWNFPFWQVYRFAAPALMAGNTVILKHSSNVTGCALAIAEVFRQAGFPEDVFRSLVIGSAGVAGAIAHPRVAAVTLTGSEPAGRIVARIAGECLKKTVLELGGNDPYVVLEDADLDLAARTCAASRLVNSGQSCIAAKRFIIVEAVRAEFEKRFLERMRAAKTGDPLADGIEVGPMARRDLRDELHDQVRRSIAAGARLLLGGEIPEGPGAYYPPTVLTDVRTGMAVFDEETFGPVAAIVPAADEPDAVRLANATRYGLGAAVFTRDAARGERIAAEELAAGSCFVNGLVKSDPRLPFGGIQSSGYGRELSSYGIREFVNIKTVWIG